MFATRGENRFLKSTSESQVKALEDGVVTWHLSITDKDEGDELPGDPLCDLPVGQV